jgi:hypothetical protein
MRALLALLLLIAVPAAFARGVETPVRDCGTRAYGDLGRGWQERAVVAGPLAFAGLRDGYAAAGSPPAGTAWPQKVLVVVEPASVATVTIARRSQRYAALGYHGLRHEGTKPVPLSAGTTSIRFEACPKPNPGAAVWSRGTQFPGYFLVSGRRCVSVEIAARGKVFRRTLRFGAPRCTTNP